MEAWNQCSKILGDDFNSYNDKFIKLAIKCMWNFHVNWHKTPGIWGWDWRHQNTGTWQLDLVSWPDQGSWLFLPLPKQKCQTLSGAVAGEKERRRARHWGQRSWLHTRARKPLPVPLGSQMKHSSIPVSLCCRGTAERRPRRSQCFPECFQRVLKHWNEFQFYSGLTSPIDFPLFISVKIFLIVWVVLPACMYVHQIPM